MKKREIVLVHFEHSGGYFSARVYKHSSTAIVLPDKTVLQTTTVVHTNGPRRLPSEQTHTRNIFNRDGDLLPLSVLRRPGDWDKPLNTHLPLVFADRD